MSAGKAPRRSGKGKGKGKPPAVVGLARERRVRAKLAELAALVEGGALNAERTRAFLAGELEVAPMDSDEIPTSIRLPRRLLDVADTLAARRAERTGERASRSAVLRVALERGIAALEREAAELDAPTTKAAILAELEGLRERVAVLEWSPAPSPVTQEFLDLADNRPPKVTL